MKIIHTADLHIGKSVNGFSMIDEQIYALSQVIDAIKNYDVDVLIIAGDIYDKRNPSDESVRVFNEFISNVSQFHIPILIISGNHDSGIKLQFGHDILKKHNIHIVGEYSGTISSVTLQDEYGDISFYLLPFVRPADVRTFYDSVDSYHRAIEVALQETQIDYSKRNVIISHQFYASGSQEMSDSEIIAVGGIDNIGYNLLEPFDYAALGHLHKPQKLIKETIRYSGSIVKYSESEVNDNKGIVLVELKEKGNITIEKIPLVTHKQFIKVRGYLKDILMMTPSDDYVFVTLLDDDAIDAISKVRSIFKNVMSLDFDNERTRFKSSIETVKDVDDIDADKLFSKFFELQNNKPLTKEQEDIISLVIERIDTNASH